jgi:hypothetical protein
MGLPGKGIPVRVTRDPLPEQTPEPIPDREPEPVVVPDREKEPVGA